MDRTRCQAAITCIAPRPPRRVYAFTLVELLMVIAILSLLLAMLTPTLKRARLMALDVSCRSQFHQVGLAFTTHAARHRAVLPGLWGPPWTGSEDWQKSWMGSEAFTGTFRPAAPCSAVGTTVSAMGGIESARKLYRCPALRPGVLGSGAGSNGMFDMTMVQSLPGARLDLLPLSAQVILHSVQATVTVGMPVVVEEDPVQNINRQHIDMGHTAYNRMGSWHVGGSGNYLGADGSAWHLDFDGGVGPEAQDWRAEAPSGQLRNLGVALPYGGWDTQ